MGYLPEVSRMGRKILPTRGRRLGRAWGREREDWEGGQGRKMKKEEKENPAVRHVALFMLSPSICSLHSPAVGRMLRWLKGQIRHNKDQHSTVKQLS